MRSAWVGEGKQERQEKRREKEAGERGPRGKGGRNDVARKEPSDRWTNDELNNLALTEYHGVSKKYHGLK